jgi:hypothetical protein
MSGVLELQLQRAWRLFFIAVEIICQGRWTLVTMTVSPCVRDPRRRSSTKVGNICFHRESAVRCVYSCAICRDHKSGLRRRLLKTGIAVSQFSRHLPADSCHSRATATSMGEWKLWRSQADQWLLECSLLPLWNGVVVVQSLGSPHNGRLASGCEHISRFAERYGSRTADCM